MTPHYNLNRAFEVAMVENQPLTILVDYESTNVVYLLKEKEIIENQFKDYICFANSENFAESLFCEIVKLDFESITYSKSRETIEDVLKRVNKAKSVVVKDELCQSCEALLKTGYVHLNLSEHQLSVVIKTAKNIAKLDNSNTIRPEHMAEALQYQACSYSECLQTLENHKKYLQKEIEKMRQNINANSKNIDR